MLVGAGFALSGIRLIGRPRIRRFVLVPLLINVMLFALGISYAANLFDWLVSFLPGWLDWLKYVLWPLFALAAAALVFFGFSILANLIGAPFNGFLAEAVEADLSGGSDSAPFSAARLMKELWHAIRSELTKYSYFILRALPCLLLFLIPGFNVLAPPLWLLFGAWMLALEYAEYPMGNHAMTFPEVRARLTRKRRTALGFGVTVLAMTMVPVLNFIAMPVAVCGATRMWVHVFRD
ncbi:MAG: sulfate transporter CysZ [Gammaproteobacteria bacterium]|nr:sulfate transporter CysZ [Gammaproteobacteria bacterium]